MWLHAEVLTVADIPRYWGGQTPDRIALIDQQGTATFAQLDSASSRVANALIGHGVPARSNIGFLGKNSARYFELLFGVAKAGCAMAALNWRLAIAELVPIIEDAQCPLVFVDREFVSVVETIARQCAQPFEIVVFDSNSSDPQALDAWLAAVDDADPQLRIHPLDTAVLIYTSGTTGKPKGVELTHRAFDAMRLCEHLSGAYDWRPGDMMLTVMPVFHLVGTGLSLQALYNGAGITILPMLDPGKALALIQRDRPTICALVPTAIQMLIDHPDAKTTDFSSLRLMMYAGAPITAALLRRALVETGCQFMQFYGASESLGPLTLLRPDQHDPDDEPKLRSCGKPLPEIEIRIRDPDGYDLPDGQPGELWIRGPTIFRSYWRQPEATAAVLKDGWYRTGDAGYRDAEGFIYLVDRVKDMIVTGGENVYSAEVEQALARHPAVHSCVVIGLPDPKWGEKVTAVIVLAPDLKATAQEITAHCRELLAGYKIPKSVFFTDALPLGGTGKILKRAVREQYRQAFAD
ncbi:long-chain-fatty-acid--CoA ligase [Nevskia sp.]|uniref:long-chain-fatty-acid--CoA ligase n=1 Tax=Nevskia sp. TaxID=1929292 RepID=UPI0025FA831E|nr:long-chain-fatty-acid--CoA ligase [Nevskia sp.]